MDLKFRKKCKRFCDRKLKLPLRNEEIIGIFNGLNVVIHDWSSMIFLYNEGCFGKGTFSKGEPSYNTKKDDIPKIVFEQQLKNHSSWSSTIKYICSEKNFPVRNQYELSMISSKIFFESSLSTSDTKIQNLWCKDEKSQKKTNLKHELSLLEFSAGETYSDDKLRQIVDDILQSRQIKKFTSCFGVKNEVIILSPDSQVVLPGLENIIARLEHQYLLPEENLNLNWEESLYLKSIFGCLTIVGWDKRNFTDAELWEKFKTLDKNFVAKYVTYHYYRSKGWIVRSGVKFGGDYLLYKMGPAYFHANYVIKVLDERKMSWRELIVNDRLAETFNKDVVFVTVSSVKKEGNINGEVFPELLENYKVEENFVKRWFPSKERKSKKKTF